ncbi:MAG: phenylacetate--CoA ligase family protein, partial [Desulfobacteraceae bacterium]|nr:phenylacetate--CoA ligase family protein [Desulfobacteraceae bacterium]
LHKERLKAAIPEEVVAQGIKPAKCKPIKTSGSTGTPLRIYLGPAEERWQRAVAWRILFEHGFRWRFRTLEIRMTLDRGFLVQMIGVAPKDWLSILDPPESWVRCLIEKQHQVIVASASTLNTLAETIRALNLKVIPPRIVISDSETLTPVTRRSIRQALGTDPVDVFGLVELSNFAWQCEQRDGFHVSADSHIVEVATHPGEAVGPIIATGLGMWTMPIIRYYTGDLAEVDPEPCLCGRSLPLLRRIYGRAIDSVILPSGRRLLWPFFHETLGEYGELRQWRVIQTDLQHLEIQLVIPDGDLILLERIKTDLCHALPEKIKLGVKRVDNIQIEPGEKARMIISRETSKSDEIRSRIFPPFEKGG